MSKEKLHIQNCRFIRNVQS